MPAHHTDFGDVPGELLFIGFFETTFYLIRHAGEGVNIIPLSSPPSLCLSLVFLDASTPPSVLLLLTRLWGDPRPWLMESCCSDCSPVPSCPSLTRPGWALGWITWWYYRLNVRRPWPGPSWLSFSPSSLSPTLRYQGGNTASIGNTTSWVLTAHL